MSYSDRRELFGDTGLFKYSDVHASLHRVGQVAEFIKTKTTEVVDPLHWFVGVEFCIHTDDSLT